MKSGVVVYVIRICGQIFTVRRMGQRVRLRRIGTYAHTPPDQRPVIEQLRG